MAGAAIPQKFKHLQHYMKISLEHEKRDPVVAYYCKLYAVQAGMKIDRKSPDCIGFLTGLMDELETLKKRLKDDDALVTELVGQAHMENYALKLFLFADTEDRAGRFNKNVVKSFYTAGMLYDVLTNFGELTDEDEHRHKYAKWKAAYIHNCLKNGETPVAGPVGQEFEESGIGASDPSNPNVYAPPAPSSTTPYPPGPTDQQSYPPGPTDHQPYPPGPTDQQQPHPPAGNHLNPPANSQRPASPAFYQPSDGAQSNSGSNVDIEGCKQAQKWCKFAISALEYQDKATALGYLEKTMRLLTTGEQE